MLAISGTDFDGSGGGVAAGALIDIDAATFDPWRVQPVRHGLVGHPLLSMPSLTALGQRLEASGSIRSHDNTATAATPFADAPKLHPNRRCAGDTLATIEDASAWISLLNVQADPLYREFVGSTLDGVRPIVERVDPGMCHRGGWIFVTSPRTVTPFHFDKEHNLILQIQGRKRLYVWDPDDTVVASERARDRFHRSHSRELLRWDDRFRERAHVYDLEPGQGAYMPSTSPHLVENADAPSITLSLTYYTDDTRRRAVLHKAHDYARAMGIDVADVGRNRLLDTIVHAALSAGVSVRNALRGGGPRGPGRFAQVDQ